MASLDSKDSKTDEEKYTTFFENYFSHKSKFKIKSIKLTPCCPAGENFVADVHQITIIGNYAHDKTESGIITKTAVIKKLPPKNSLLNSLYNLSKLHDNEIIAYEKILPTFQKFLDNYNLNICFPEYYGRMDDFLVLEDLKVRGYQMVNRIQGLRFEECKLVLRELALLQATSFALDKKFDLQESIFLPEYIDGILGVIWENSLKFAVKSLESSNNEILIQIGKKLKKYSGSVLNSLIDITKPSDSYGVICHGDLWSNNVMIRYDDDGRSPISVKFLDLQALRHSSCVLDVMHLIFTSTKPGMLKSHLKELLKIYFDGLDFFSKILNWPLKFSPADLEEEFKEKITYGLLVSFLMFTVVTRRDEDETENFSFDKEDLKAKFEKMYEDLNEDYHFRVRTLVLDLLNLKFLS